MCSARFCHEEPILNDRKNSSGSVILRTCMAIKMRLKIGYLKMLMILAVIYLLTIERDSLMTRLVVMTLKNMELKRGFLFISGPSGDDEPTLSLICLSLVKAGGA